MGVHIDAIFLDVPPSGLRYLLLLWLSLADSHRFAKLQGSMLLAQQRCMDVHLAPAHEDTHVLYPSSPPRVHDSCFIENRESVGYSTPAFVHDIGSAAHSRSCPYENITLRD